MNNNISASIVSAIATGVTYYYFSEKRIHKSSLFEEFVVPIFFSSVIGGITYTFVTKIISQD